MSSSDSSPLASIPAAVARQIVAMLGSVWERPLLYWGFLVPLSVTVLEESGALVATVPPIVPLTALFFLLVTLRVGTRRVVSTLRTSPGALWMYVVVCAIEALLVLYQRNPQGWTWVAGRVTFFLVMAATVAGCSDVNDVKDALRGLTCGVGVIGLLTVVHAMGFVDVPSAYPLRWAGRTFGTFQIPFARTLGLRMTYNKFGVLAAAALATVLAPSAGDQRIIRPTWYRVESLFTIMAAVMLSQTRGVYLTILWTLGLSAALRLGMRGRLPRLSSARGAWLAAAAFTLLLILGNVLFPVLAPQWLINVGYQTSVSNVLVRLNLNAQGWLVFRQEPLLGIGHGVLAGLQPGGANIHNHFWEHLVSTGIVGGIPYLLFHMLILVGALRLLGSSRPSFRAIAVVLVVSVSATYLAYQFSLLFFTSVFALICGLVLALNREEGGLSSARTEHRI
jgi:hypothetical protein